GKGKPASRSQSFGTVRQPWHQQRSSMSIPQPIVDRLEDYLDGNLDRAGHEAVAAWCNESDANREALAAWFLSQVELFEASRLADMRNVFEGFAFDPRANGDPQVSL